MDRILIDLSVIHYQANTQRRKFMRKLKSTSNEEAHRSIAWLKWCDLLGKEDAIYLPSGTMCNQVVVFTVGPGMRSSWIPPPTHATMKPRPLSLERRLHLSCGRKRGSFQRTVGSSDSASSDHLPNSKWRLWNQASNLGRLHSLLKPSSRLPGCREQERPVTWMERA
jgi:hypothetical protein